jgi:multimeric flavodoxin WrbA
MKVVAFNGSVRKEGNTSILLKTVLVELQAAGVETELIEMAGQSLSGCVACYRCGKNKDNKCAREADWVNEAIAKMIQADGILLGSPVYIADMTANMKALIERATVVSRSNDDFLKRKVGAAVVVARRAGSSHTFSSLNYFFLINQMIIAGSSYWNIGIGRSAGDVRKDPEGLQTMITLGQNMAWILKKLSS